MATIPERTPSIRISGETIYQSCVDLHNAGKQINRQRLSEVTGLKMSIIDDHVTRLCNADKLRKLHGGFVEPIETFPANRKVGKQIMRDGMREITLGGETLEMTPSEAGEVGLLLASEAAMISRLTGDRDVHDKVFRLERLRQEDRRRMDELINTISRLSSGLPEFV